MIIKEKSFGTLNGVDYKEIFITNKNGNTVSFSDLGARINRLEIRDKHNAVQNIILGFNNAEHAYEGRGYYYGATVGRVAGRIGKGHFRLNGKDYQLPINDGAHHLHGGENSFDSKQWSYTIEEKENSVAVIFELVSEDSENGYPGKLAVRVIHTFDDNDQWTIKYYAESDQDTLFNPTNHVYFNLNGNNSAPVTNHNMRINADKYVPVNEDVTPIGAIENVEGTPFDLKETRQLSDLLRHPHQQTELIDGFDHPFVFKGSDNFVDLDSPLTGIKVSMRTTLPAVVVYSHQSVSVPMEIWGNPLEKYSGITIETQILPDAINQDGFGDIVLEAGTTYESETSFKMSIL